VEEEPKVSGQTEQSKGIAKGVKTFGYMSMGITFNIR